MFVARTRATAPNMTNSAFPDTNKIQSLIFEYILKTTFLCLGSRFSTEKKSGAHFRVNGEIRKLVPELNTCKCDPYTGRCEKINYCIQFGYLLKGYSALHVRASAKSICKFKGGRYRTKDYSGKIIRLSASKSWGWRDVKINFLVECAEKQSVSSIFLFIHNKGRWSANLLSYRNIRFHSTSAVWFLSSSAADMSR